MQRRGSAHCSSLQGRQNS